MDKNILIAEDSVSVRQMMAMTLSDAGYKVSEAGDGSEALQKMQQEVFSMLITDLNMPKVDGIDLIRQVRQDSSRRFMPIVMLTSENDENKRLEGKEAGASAWMTKPFKPHNLAKLVQMVLG